MVYIKSRFKRKVKFYFYIYLDTIKIEGKTINPNQIINYLKRLFDDPN